MDRPEKLNKKIIFEKYGKRLISQDFRLPDGRVTDYIILESTMLPAIVFPLTADNKVIAIRQFRYAIDDYIIELPGGCPNTEISSIQTAISELLEETGYRSDTITQLGPRLFMDPAISSATFAPILALRCEKVKEQKINDTEFIEVLEVPLADWTQQVGGGEIKDLKSIALTHLALAWLGKEKIL